ncbi:MAG: acetolactate decarboxylase [Syntrophobacterales bacterium]|nr:MAG: acetolactate decarboxylase [Syntrophobacterales bacterium]
MKKYAVSIVICFFLFFLSFPAPAQDTVMQISTIDALVAGLYDGTMSCDRLLQYGDLGIGTFDRLEGEMLVLDGTVYQVKADGTVHTPDGKMTTPFAAVCRFGADDTITLKKGMSFSELEEMLDASISNKNLFYAIKMTGTFSYMKTRSVPAQDKPYPPLAEVTKKQSVFEMKNISGTIVGFRCPTYVKGINVPGYHLHFISDDRSRGGHILGLETDTGNCAIDRCNQFFMVLPTEGEAFQKVDLSKDRTRDLYQIEK